MADSPPSQEPAAPTPESRPPAEPSESVTQRRQQLSRAGSVSAATMTSRLLGLLREHVFAKLFGAGAISDAFVIAYRIPNLLRDLFAEGALSSAFVPTFTRTKEKDGAQAAFALAQVVFSFLTVAVGLLTLAGVIWAPTLVDVIAPGFEGTIENNDGSVAPQRDLTIRLTRILMPFLLLVSLAAVCRGILNSHHRYFLPAVSPALFNSVAVVIGFMLWYLDVAPDVAIHGWALATLLGGLVQLAVQLPALWRLGFRPGFSLRWSHEGFQRILRLMAPATIGLAAVQVNILINSILASLLEEGAPTWLQLGFRLVYLPIGVIGVAVATVSTVTLSSRVAQEDNEGFGRDLSSALGLVAFLTVPATVGLMVLSEPIIRLVFEYGRFTPESTIRTAAALTCYSVGLFCYSAVKVLAPAFYALHKIRIPMVASIAGVLVNVAWSLATYRTFGFTSLAVGTALASLVNFCILTLALRRHASPAGHGLLANFLKLLVISLAMGWCVYQSNQALEAWLGTATLGVRSVGVLAPVALGIAVVICLGLLLRIPEAQDFSSLVRRRRAQEK